MIKRSIIFGKEHSLEFEDGVYPAVSGYDEYLTVNYGNWREDLPPEQQRGHDLTLGDIEWKLEAHSTHIDT